VQSEKSPSADKNCVEASMRALNNHDKPIQGLYLHLLL
jgi:hypothetical protein